MDEDACVRILKLIEAYIAIYFVKDSMGKILEIQD